MFLGYFIDFSRQVFEIHVRGQIDAKCDFGNLRSATKYSKLIKRNVFCMQIKVNTADTEDV